MALKLRVISDHYKALGKRSSRLFGVTGGRIGRSQDNDWILPDPDRYVSSHHCKVDFKAGQWILEDTSTNGVFINGSDTPASVEGAYRLQDGDRLRLGDYEVLVSIDERNDFAADASGQIPAPPRVRNKSNVRTAPKATDNDLGEELDLTDLITDSAIAPAPILPPPHRAPSASAPLDLESALALDADDLKAMAPIPAAPTPAKAPRTAFASLLGDSGEHKTVAHGRKAEAKPEAAKADDWHMQTRPYDRKALQALTSSAALPRPEKAEPERPKRAADSGSAESSTGVEAFCRGAGIDPANLPADTQNVLLTLAGQMLRESVLGLMDGLKGRSDLKSRLRLNQTTIQPGENNPLKFSASVDEAVLKLLDPHSNRYLGPIEAIRESFADIRTHQTALVGAIQAAVDELMNRIEPGELQERFDRGLKRGPLLGATNKMKYWDLYTEFYQVLNQRSEQGLPTLFSEELARTYAEKVAPKKK
ncbi:MAG TPA: type VI secretion system-associated FHA domain protein TagH [Steroidobacteraceae bacterium]|nr:type VI secretion system-associated FHA domain protein TagH [Steroidobacteraceae bacterium]HKR36519.1 type VI secretion system-associated FHA domain protein TagH [Steroidobacteraceae bacterium]